MGRKRVRALAIVAGMALVTAAAALPGAAFGRSHGGTARGVVTIPEGERRFRFVEIAVALDVELDPLPDPDALAQLLERAERDCFVGASLISKPEYHWKVAAQ